MGVLDEIYALYGLEKPAPEPPEPEPEPPKLGVLDEIYALYGQEGQAAEKSKSAQKCTDKTDKTAKTSETEKSKSAQKCTDKTDKTSETTQKGGFVSFVSSDSGDFVKKIGGAEVGAGDMATASRWWRIHHHDRNVTGISSSCDKCHNEASATELDAFPDDRRTCRQCANLEGRRCMAAKRGEIVASPDYEPVRNIPRRCEGYAAQKP